MDMAAAEDGTRDATAYRGGSRCLTPQTHRVETQYLRTAHLAHVSNILRVQTHSNPLTVKTYFYITYSEAKSEGRAGCCAPHPKEEPTLSTTDGTYIKPICPSGGHGHGHRLALQNRAAARNVPLTVNNLHLCLAALSAPGRPSSEAGESLGGRSGG